MRAFYILNERAINPEILPSISAKRERLRYRDMIWAFHSESQDLLLGACSSACGGKMTWADARALCIPLWLNSPDTLVRPWANISVLNTDIFCGIRGNKSRSLLGTSIWLEKCAILRLVLYTTSLWESTSLCMGCGDKPPHTRSKA